MRFDIAACLAIPRISIAVELETMVEDGKGGYEMMRLDITNIEPTCAVNPPHLGDVCTGRRPKISWNTYGGHEALGCQHMRETDVWALGVVCWL